MANSFFDSYTERQMDDMPSISEDSVSFVCGFCRSGACRLCTGKNCDCPGRYGKASLTHGHGNMPKLDVVRDMPKQKYPWDGPDWNDTNKEAPAKQTCDCNAVAYEGRHFANCPAAPSIRSQEARDGRATDLTDELDRAEPKTVMQGRVAVMREGEAEGEQREPGESSGGSPAAVDHLMSLIERAAEKGINVEGVIKRLVPGFTTLDKLTDAQVATVAGVLESL